tara:strand:- start:1167 stop:1841 length:675 start_codon:yes stop_codon:yes gene_type:complete
MAYYLGRDVKVWALLESSDNLGIATDGTNGASKVSEGTAGSWAFGRRATGLVDGYALGDLTGVDLSIGTTDEDITYVGQRSVLKAEIKKETTMTLTRKKSTLEWDVLFNGPVKSGDEITSGTLTHGARWGVTSAVGGASKISDGLRSPKDHNAASGDIEFGYRMVLKLNSSEFFVMRNAQIASHGVTLNADGTTEETLELISQVTPLIKTVVADCVAATASSDI